MADKQTTTGRWATDASGRRIRITETKGRDEGSSEDYQDTSGLAAAAARARAKRETVEDQAEAISKPPKRKKKPAEMNY